MNLVANLINAFSPSPTISAFWLGLCIGRGFASSRFGYDPLSGGRLGRYRFDRCEMDYPSLRRHIFGLVSSTIAETGFEALAGYMQLLAVLLGCMLFIALAVNPIIVWTQIRQQSFPPRCLPACAKAACMPSLPVLFRRQHPCEHGIGEKTGSARRHLLYLHSIGCNHQYGRCGNHHYRFGDGCGAHARHYS